MFLWPLTTIFRVNDHRTQLLNTHRQRSFAFSLELDAMITRNAGRSFAADVLNGLFSVQQKKKHLRDRTTSFYIHEHVDNTMILKETTGNGFRML